MMPSNKDNDRRLTEILSAVDRGRDVPDGVFLERLRERTGKEFQAASAEIQQTKKTTIWGLIMKSKITKFAAVAAVLIAAIIFGVIQFGGSVDGASVAWADVIKPILHAQTAIFTMIIGEEGKSPEIQDMVMGSRIRRTIAGIEDVSIIDLETSRILTLDPKAKKAVYIDLKGLPKIPNYLENLRNVITMMEEEPQFVVEELGEKVIDGTNAVGFRAVHPQAEVTIWADGETALPIRIEQQEGQFNLIIKDFQFDVEMDESLFSMEVPEGYSQQQIELDLFGSTESDFIEGLRVWAEVIGGGTFPDDVSVEYFIKQVPMMQEVFVEMDASDDEETELGLKLQKYLLFIRFFKGEGKWHYAGKGVALGEGETAIFWYKPKGSETFRVIYGDLTVKEVAPEDLPQPLKVDEGVKELLKAEATKFVDLLTAKKFAEAHSMFGPTMSKAVSAEKLEEVLAYIEQVGGKYLGRDEIQRIERIEIPRKGKLTAVFVPCRWELKRVEFKVAFNEANQITGLWTLDPTQTKKSVGVQQWSKPDAVGRQEDQWHILASGEIEAHSFVTLTKIPKDMPSLPISLPYPNAQLQSVSLGETNVEFSQSGPGKYELELTPEKLSEGETTFEAVWTMPLETIKTAGGKYHTELNFLIPAISYKLLVILAPDSGYEFTHAPEENSFVPYTWGGGGRTPRTHVGSCGLSLKKND